jgi:hypothetical protein
MRESGFEQLMDDPETKKLDSELDKTLEKIPYSENASSILEFFQAEYLGSDENSRTELYHKAEQIVATGASTEASINAMRTFLDRVRTGEVPTPERKLVNLVENIGPNIATAKYQDKPEQN